MRADQLEVTLDSRRLTFEQKGQFTETVRIPADWEGPPRIGNNAGTAGAAFFCEPVRRKAGGQQARRFFHPAGVKGDKLGRVNQAIFRSIFRQSFGFPFRISEHIIWYGRACMGNLDVPEILILLSLFGCALWALYNWRHTHTHNPK